MAHRSGGAALQERAATTAEDGTRRGPQLRIVDDAQPIEANPIEAPRINEATFGRRVEVKDLADEVRRAWVTAGASSAVQEPTEWIPFKMPRVVEDEPRFFTATGFNRNVAEQDPMRYYVALGADAPRVTTAQTVDVIPGFTFFNVDPIESYQSVRRSAIRGRDQALAEFRRRLDASAATYSQMSPRDVVIYLTEILGVGQLATARAVAVSPTAVRKWRRGESARTEHRSRLAQFAALCEVLTETGLHDPASWLEIPISTESILTKLDLFVAGRGDLVLLLAAGLSEPQETLDLFAPDWRARFPTDAEYEVIELDDGSRAVVPRLER
jgi:hypothetical protein